MLFFCSNDFVISLYALITCVCGRECFISQPELLQPDREMTEDITVYSRTIACYHHLGRTEIRVSILLQ